MAVLFSLTENVTSIDKINVISIIINFYSIIGFEESNLELMIEGDTIMTRFGLIVAALALTSTAHAGDFDAATAHGPFIDAFNARDWDAVKAVFTDDAVFHRASGDTAFMGPDAIVERFSSTIGNEGEWNVKFVKLDSTSALTGKDGSVVERGDFAVTAGADDSGCYAGSYMMTWKTADGGTWGLQHFAWQDVEAETATCQ